MFVACNLKKHKYANKNLPCGKFVMKTNKLKMKMKFKKKKILKVKKKCMQEQHGYGL